MQYVFLKIFNATLRKILIKFLPSAILKTGDTNMEHIGYSNNKYMIEALEKNNGEIRF